MISVIGNVGRAPSEPALSRAVARPPKWSQKNPLSLEYFAYFAVSAAFLFAGVLASSGAEPPPLDKAKAAIWERSIVTVEVARKQYDFTQPWTRRTKRIQKTAIVVADRQVLTTAEELFDRTLVRLQK